MRRRELLGLCAAGVSSSFAIGSNAFSFANVERTVSIGVEEDYDSYLRLEEVGPGDRSEIDDGKVNLNIPGEDEGEYNSENPAGIGTDSIYRFGKDAGSDSGEGLLRITNQGTQPVEIYSTQATTSGVPTVTIYDVDSGDLLTEDRPSDPLTVGGQLLCGLVVDTHDVDTAEYDVTLTINAVAPDASD